MDSSVYRSNIPNAKSIVPGSLWLYAPAKGPSIGFAILFLISGVLHVWQNNVKHRSFRIGFLLPWAAALFVAGFVLREYGAWDGHYLFISYAKSKDRKSTRLNSSHVRISYAVFCLK